MMEVQASVESESSMVFFSDGQGEFRESACSEVGVAVAEKLLANAVAAIFRQGADLGNVADVVAHARAEQEPDAGVCRAVEGSQPGKRTMLLRKRSEPAVVRYWSLTSLSM